MRLNVVSFVFLFAPVAALNAGNIGIAVNGTCVTGSCPAAPFPFNFTDNQSFDYALTLPDGDKYLIYGSFSGSNGSGAGFSTNHIFQVTYEGNATSGTSAADTVIVQAYYAFQATAGTVTFNRDLLGAFGPTIAGSSSASSCVNDVLGCLGPVMPPGSFDRTTSFPLTSSGGAFVFDPAFTNNFGAGSAVGSYIVWGQTTPLPEPAPEPASLGLLALGLAGVIARARASRNAGSVLERVPTKRSLCSAALLLAAAFAIPAHLAAQLPDGSDINKAIPIYFGQIVNDLGDVNTIKSKVYSITLAKGQQVSATLTAPGKVILLTLHPPTELTVVGCDYNCAAGSVANSGDQRDAASFTYTVATAGTYYVKASFGSVGTNYSLQVKAVGTPIVSPLPTSAGCLTGQVDYLTYSLQLISAGLPDEASIGGTKLCASCTVKPPAYPELVGKMETSMGLSASVSACYDSTGNIFQIKLIHP